MSFDFGKSKYNLTVHEYDMDRQQAVVTLTPNEPPSSLASEFEKPPAEYDVGTPIRLDNGVEITFEKVFMSVRSRLDCSQGHFSG